MDLLRDNADDMGRCKGDARAAGQTVDRSKLVDLTSGTGGPASSIAVLR